MTAQQQEYRTDENDFIDFADESTQAWLDQKYPAVMANGPTGMSGGYQFMPTYKVVEYLQEKHDMKPVSVNQQHSRARDPRGQEHVVRLRFSDKVARGFGDGGSEPELVLMNSHNGRTTMRAYLGIFRMVCSNGMVISNENDVNGKSAIRHFGEDNNMEALVKMLDHMHRRVEVMSDRIQLMQSVLLTKHDQNQLAKAMIEIRKAPDWVEAQDVLDPKYDGDRQDEDGTRDMWATFNVIQNSLIHSELVFEKEGERRRSTRKITSARASVFANEALWNALEEFIDQRRDRMPEGLLIMHPADAELPLDGQADTDDGATAQPVGPRSFEVLMALETFAEMDAIAEDERAALDKEQRTKLSKRKSYLKSKKPVDA